jgi:acetyl-CoA C-acetyltransferase
MSKDPIVITSVLRTPMGGFLGDLKSESAPKLASPVIQKVLEDSKIQGHEVDEVLMGCVLQAGVKQGPARQAALGALIPTDVGCVTINKLCGSAMKAAMLGYDSIIAGTNSIVVAGGMESMSNAPYLLDRARNGYRLGHGKILDHMFCDGLEDAYQGRLMGTFAEETAEFYQFTREQQDVFAIESLKRAQKAIKEGLMSKEIVPLIVKAGKNTVTIHQDEQPLKADFQKIPTLKPAFKEGGTITAANSSSISDGAAALVMMRESEAERRGITPLARIIGHSTHAQEPAWFTTAPVKAMDKLIQKTGWNLKDTDLFEINEAFAIVTMAAMKDLLIPHEKVNIHGGACALGHPIGASGVRILATLIHALHHYDLKRGIASLCIGGGEATAMAIEKIK